MSKKTVDDTSENSCDLSFCPAIGLVLGVATGEKGILHEESAINQEKRGMPQLKTQSYEVLNGSKWDRNEKWNCQKPQDHLL